MHLADEALGQGLAGFVILGGTLDDLVIHIGDVAHKIDLIAQIAQVTHHHIETDKGAAMADMTEIVDGYATDIHAHLARMDGFEFFFLACQ